MRLGTVARREALLSWLRERVAHQGLTAGEIASVSGLYDDVRDKAGAAQNDLYDLSPHVRWERGVRRGHEVSVWHPSEGSER